MNVLVPWDRSEQSRYALTAAAERFPDHQITVVHVIEPFADYTWSGGRSVGRSQQLEAAAEQLLAEALELLPPEITAETELRYGRPIHEIIQLVTDGEFSHIVIGSHGRDGPARLLLGSVAETVVRRSPVPVTVIRERDHTDPPETVLVAFDGSAESQDALVYAIEHYPDVPITALYVRYPPSDDTAPTSQATPDVITEWLEGIGKQTESIVPLAESTAADAGRSISINSAEGDPASEIVAFADSEGFDHVVLGSHGRDGLSRLLLGSVAETVVRRSPTSVTVVR